MTSLLHTNLRSKILGFTKTSIVFMYSVFDLNMVFVVLPHCDQTIHAIILSLALYKFVLNLAN